MKMKWTDRLKCVLSWHDWEVVKFRLFLGDVFRLRCRRCGKII
jgi:hypothetical protein